VRGAWQVVQQQQRRTGAENPDVEAVHVAPAMRLDRIGRATESSFGQRLGGGVVVVVVVGSDGPCLCGREPGGQALEMADQDVVAATEQADPLGRHRQRRPVKRD
jgi:hypothetical protein